MLTRELVESLGFEIAKKKYYNASKVDAVIEPLKSGIIELLDEIDRLNGELARQQETIDTLRENEQELLNAGEALRKADELKNRAEELMNSAELESGKLLKNAEHRSETLIKNAELESGEIMKKADFEARKIIKAAEIKAAAFSPVKMDGHLGGALSKDQVKAIEEINKQLEELGSQQATQVMKIRSTLIKMATEL